MREPRLGELTIDEAGTAKFRASLAGQKAVTITIHVDTKSLQGLKEVSRETGVPYQTLVGRVLRDAVKSKATTESRLDRLERELKRMKRILVA
jgi:predicted DNA binding CopG/RHH family protein